MPIGLGSAGSAIAAAVAQQQSARMVGDRRLPIAADHLPGSLVVFDAIVKPEVTPLLALAQRCGCRTVQGREMTRGQIAQMVDFFLERSRVPVATAAPEPKRTRCGRGAASVGSESETIPNRHPANAVRRQARERPPRKTRAAPTQAFGTRCDEHRVRCLHAGGSFKGAQDGSEKGLVVCGRVVGRRGWGGGRRGTGRRWRWQ
jgi:hypothetical protein